MVVNFELIRPLLKRRFSRAGCYIESAILDALGGYYYDGDRVTWEAHRRAGYKMYHRGCTVNEIASRHKVHAWIVEWWISIWEVYDKAWSPKKYN